MKTRILSALFISMALAAPLQAQEESPPISDDLQQGLDILERGTRMLLESLIAELGPAWDELRQMLNDLNAYHPPEILPNGDIIIRRKVPLVPQEPGDDATEL